MEIPHFENHNGQSIFLVNDKIFIGLAAECHNSSASSKKYMDEIVWPRVLSLNVNTVLIPVYWEVIESKKGHFDFSSVRDLIVSARCHKVKLVLLWFGLWKNGQSTYIPEWLKKDPEVKYARRSDGKRIYSISPSDTRSIDYDARAFGKLMEYLKKIDSNNSTVIMVQVENEVGLLHSDFDYSIDKNSVLKKKIPSILSQSNSETWLGRFGLRAGEYYMAFLYASAIQRISFNGKQNYSLPLFVNAWLEKPLGRPGTYPTGGPTFRMLSTWTKVATSLDLVAPDLYVPNFKEVCDSFSNSQSAILIPETRQDLQTVSNIIYGISHYNLCLFSPFGAEDFFSKDRVSDSRLLNAISIDADAFNWEQTGPVLAETYSLLSGMVQILTKYRMSSHMHSFMVKEASDRGREINLSGYKVIVHFLKQEGNVSPSAGFIIEVANGEFLLFGINIRVELASLDSRFDIGILSLEEGKMVADEWRRGRILNGDERVNIKIDAMPRLFKIKIHLY